MLYHRIAKLREGKIINGINAFLCTPWYMLCVALIMAASNIFSLEFMAFYVYMAIVVYVTLFAPDCFPIAPMCCCGYMLFSAQNNPASEYGETMFSTRENVVQFVVIAAIIGVSLIARFIFEARYVRRERKGKPALTWGFFLLGIVYLLSGAFTPDYGGKQLAYAALQILSLCITYFYFYYTVDWEKRKAGDAAAMFSAVGVGLFLEIIGLYLQPTIMEAIQTNTFERLMLETGWGVYNNVGGMMIMLMPAPFYFAATKKHPLPYLMLGSLFMLGTILTQSRGSILMGSVVYLLCCIATLIYLPKHHRWRAVIGLFLIFVIAVLLLGVVYFAQEGLGISVLSFGIELTDDNGRYKIYRFGIEQFLESPFLGTGWYATVARVYQHGWQNIPDSFFIPPRYHNTVIQLLATGGIVALAAYAFHRIQTMKLFFRNPTAKKTFLGLCIFAHLLASLLDCNFFNLGPGLTYGLMLLFAEMLPETNPRSTRRVRKNTPQSEDETPLATVGEPLANG